MVDQFSPWNYLPSEDEIDAYFDVGFELHDFLKQHHDSFPTRAEPLALAHIGYLICTNEIATAIELLDKIEQPPRAHAKLICFLRFLTREAKDVRGQFSFSDLAESDVYLAACYFHQHLHKTDGSDKESPLYQMTEWNYSDVVRSFSDQRSSNRFKTFGVQPRVAELAFRTIYESRHGSRSTDALRDENLKVIHALPRPWSLGLRPNLPSSDYVSVYGQEFDVKSNVFLRSKKHLGLRGLFIPLPKRASSSRIAFPGIVFYRTDDDSCAWVYVGDYEPEHLPPIEADPDRDRVTPFALRVPDANRFVLDASNIELTDAEFQEALEILPLESLRFGWKLACQRRARKRRYRYKFAEYLDLIVDECLRRPSEILLEYRLWEAINSAFFRVRSALPAGGSRIPALLRRRAGDYYIIANQIPGD